MKKYVREIDYEKIYSESIILIGPLNAGKSTIARKLLKRNETDDLYYIPFDSIADIYMDMCGYDKRKALNYYESGDFERYLKYQEQFRFRFVKNMIDNLDAPTLMNLGGGDTLAFGDNKTRLKQLLSKFSNVVQILPSSDPAKSLKILEERWDRGEYEIGHFYDMVNWYLLNDGINDELATITVYTEGKTPEETVDEILELIKERKHIL